jgi:hypothetical protein
MKLLVMAAAAGAVCTLVGAESIRQSGFESFHSGTFGSGGANLYVSRKGGVQVINRWDLNNDGYNDVLISNDHDNFEIVDAFIYWNSDKGFTPLLPDRWREIPLAQTLFRLLDKGTPGLTRLPAFGGGRSLIADLNRDGFPELVFCNYIHNYPGLRTAYVYWGSTSGYKPEKKTELPTNWAAGVAAGDLNRDGYPDLVFANQGAEAGLENISRDTGLDSFIYWGSPGGFEAEKPARLPTKGARDVAIADVNGDGFQDLVFLNGVRKVEDVQIFWGAASGYSPSRTSSLPIGHPTAIRTGDLNGDGFHDLVIATAGGAQSLGLEGRDQNAAAEVIIMYGAASGIDVKRNVRLPAAQPRDIAIADMNGDGTPDIAVANAGGAESFVYWGSQPGFSPANKAVLPTMSANGVAAGDFNMDGHVDLVFANSNNGETHDVPSYVYWGSASGFAPYLRSDLQSFGAASVSSGDLNRDGRPEIVLINQYSGRDSGKLDSSIFWGNPHHYYSTASATWLPTRGAYDTTVADFDDDGYPDIVFANAYIPAAYLYRGSPKGYSAERRQLLEIGTTYASGAADLNRDGYLDLVFSGLVRGKPTGTILWGSPEGFTTARKALLKLRAKRSALTLVIADFNRDGYLDLSFSDHYFGMLEIYWGREDGYLESRVWTRETQGGGLGVADLNGDGILDYVIPGMFDVHRKSYNNRTLVYLGTAKGTPEEKPIADVDGFGTIECAISDLNRDNILDLACTNYMSDTTRSIPMFIYWGLGGGRFRNDKRTELPAESSAGIQTLDLNRDGYPELIVHNHLKNGIHSIPTNIYWNGPKSFHPDRKTELPAYGPHFSQMVPVGNQLTRKLEEEYTSAPIQIPANKRLAGLTWKADSPSGSRIAFEVRESDSRESLERAAWHSPEKSSGHPMRWMQYRVIFASTDASTWPKLYDVEISLVN